ncbi:hypothetical protein ACHWQZ_G019486 [Mnemiopsis leidyi]
MITSNDINEYGINVEGRIFWITYLVIVLLSSLIGDSIILLATIKYNAIKLNKFLVTIMQHIAVCDILTSLSFVLPTLISLIANRWILGEVLAYIHIFLNVFSIQAGIYLTCVLTSSKLLILRFTKSSSSWHAKHAHVVCCVIWGCALIWPALRLGFDQYGLLFSYVHYNINFGIYTEYTDFDKALNEVFVYAVLYIPLLIVILTTCGILYYLRAARKAARASGGHVRWQGIVTVVTVAVFLLISFLPDSITALPLTKIAPEDTPKFSRAFEMLNTFNVVTNFYIYLFTIPSFRDFVRAGVGVVWVGVRSAVCKKWVHAAGAETERSAGRVNRIETMEQSLV